MNIQYLQDGSTHEAEYDTVLMATGRKALTAEMKVANAGIKVVPDNAKIDAVNEQTNVPNIYAVGDVLHVSTVAAESQNWLVKSFWVKFVVNIFHM